MVAIDSIAEKTVLKKQETEVYLTFLKEKQLLFKRL